MVTVSETDRVEPAGAAFSVSAAQGSVWPIVLEMPEETPLTSQLLLRISEQNDGLRFERNADGDLEIMTPASNESDEASAEISRQIGNWIRSGIGGMLQGSSGGFDLPQGPIRSPDAGWLSKERLATLTPEQRSQSFKPIAPEFLVEVRSPSQELPHQQRKMVEWLQGGMVLGWLVDPEAETVYIYREGDSDELVELVERPDELSAEPTCPGLTISFEYVWNLGSSAE